MQLFLSSQFTADALCIGGINLDRKLKALQSLHAASSNACIASESPGGVARNVAENLARLGLQVSLIGHVSQDAAAHAVLAPLRELGVNTDACLVSQTGSTGSYTAVLDAQGQLRIGMADMALTELLTPELLSPVMKDRTAKLWMADMNLPASSLAWLGALAHGKQERLVMLAVSEPKMQRLPEDLRGVDTLVLNRAELATLCVSLGWQQEPTAVKAAFIQLHAAGLERLVVTLGEHGVACIEAGNAHETKLMPEPSQAFTIVDVSGAGDAFCAGLCASYLRYPLDALGKHVQRAMRLGLLTVQSPYTVSHAITPDLI